MPIIMKISYITTYDASDLKNWSGLGYYIANSMINQNAEIDFIGNLTAKADYSLRLKSFYYKTLGKKFAFDREPYIVNQFAQKASALLNPNTDIIFSPGSIPIALLESHKPKVFYTDATFAGMLGFYKEFSNFCSETIKHGNYLEQKALDSSELVIYSSDWAAKTAIENYNINPNKIKIVPFGANLESNRNLDSIKELVSKRSKKVCNLLFLGVDWERKGGDLAIEVAKKLNTEGLETKLHLLGIPKEITQTFPSFVINHGFISKSTADGKEKINNIISECHFLILPTKAEAFGLALCEANSFGIPCLATNIGGIPTIIKDNINGKLFSLTDSINDYVDYILTLFYDSNKYQELSFSSFNEYESRLNWEVSGKSIMNILKQL